MMERIFVAVAVAVGLFLIVPVLVIVPMSFSDAISFEFPPRAYSLGFYRSFFQDPSWLNSTWNSLLIATVTCLATMSLVVPAAFAYVRRRFFGRTLVNLLIMSPLVVPLVVSALGYYGLLSLIRLNGTVLGVIIAHTALAIPVTFLIVSASLKGFDQTLERAAMNAGAPPVSTFFYVTLPVLWPGMLTAALFAFLTSFNEAVVALFIGGRDASTLPKKMYESIRLESDPVIAVVSTLLIGAVCILFLLALLLSKRARNAR
jgi:putative spermidine/putrescine transport system permease protein